MSRILVFHDTHVSLKSSSPPNKHSRTQYRDDEDHIAEGAYNSLSQMNLARNLIPVRQAIKILDAKAAVDKELEKLEELPAWHLTKVKSEKEVIEKAEEKDRTVHFATLLDLFHRKNSELEPRVQKNKGRVVHRGDVVKTTLFLMLSSRNRSRRRCK